MYKEVFGLRDEIGTCPGISTFFIKAYHVKEEDKAILDKEMKRVCYLCIVKAGFSAYSSPVMLISRVATKNKIVVTAFRY